MSEISTYSMGEMTSADGTKIGFRQYGAGPALILVQGAIGTVESYHDLASHLAADFSVYVPERRGRPLSPREYAPDHSVARELEDLQAVIQVSGAHSLFGLSSGAVIALEAARVLPGIEKLALYEPPLYVPPRAMRFDLVARLNREIEAGRMAAAMATALLASGLAPRLLTLLPRVVLDRAVALLLRRDARRRIFGSASLRSLVPSLRYDFNVVSSMQNRFETFRSVRSEVVLLHGAGCRAYLREAVFHLEAILPHTRRHELAGLDHSSPWNAGQGGHPDTVAAALRDFFNGDRDRAEQS